MDRRSKYANGFGLSEVEVGSKELRDRLKRSAYLRHLLEAYHSEEDDKPHDAPVWETWLRESGELPPDFDSLPTDAFLPDPLTFNDGTPVTTPEEWQRRRQEVLDILEYYQLQLSSGPAEDDNGRAGLNSKQRSGGHSETYMPGFRAQRESCHSGLPC